MMSREQVIHKLVSAYFASRPNLQVAHDPFSVFFFACSGAGKSTVRRHLVGKLGATYVCNDEVRELLESHPEAVEVGIEIKDIVAATVKKINAEAPNKLLVYDNIIVKYYMHQDSYLNVSRAQHSPDFIIGIDVLESTLVERIKARGINASQILTDLPEQIRAYEAARKDIAPDFTFTDTYNENEMQSLTAKLIHALQH